MLWELRGWEGVVGRAGVETEGEGGGGEGLVAVRLMSAQRVAGATFDAAALSSPARWMGLLGWCWQLYCQMAGFTGLVLAAVLSDGWVYWVGAGSYTVR